MKTAFVVLAGDKMTHNRIPLDFESKMGDRSLLAATFENLRLFSGDSPILLATGSTEKNDCYRQDAQACGIPTFSLDFPFHAEGIRQIHSHVKKIDCLVLLPGNLPCLQREVFDELIKTMKTEKADAVFSSINRGIQIVRVPALEQIAEIIEKRKDDLDRFYKIGAGICDMPAEFYFAARYDSRIRFGLCSFAEVSPHLRFVQSPLCKGDSLLLKVFNDLPKKESAVAAFVETLPEQFPIPLFLRTEWTTASRLKNRYYPQSFRKRPDAEMSPELISKIFTQWQSLYGMGLYLQRERYGLAATQYSYEVGYLGEPTLHSRFEDCLTALEESYPAFHFRSGFFITDATGLTEEKSSAVLDSSFRGMMFHVNACNPEAYRVLMGCDCYETVIENIRHFTAVKRRQQQELCNRFGLIKPATGIEIVKQKETNDQIDKFFETWETYRRKRIKSVPNLNPNDFPVNSDYLSAVLANETAFLDAYYSESGNPAIEHVVLQKFSDFAGQCPDRGVVDLSPLHRAPCQTLMNSLTILANGDVTLCQQDFNGNFVIGNIKDESLMDLWNSPKLTELRHAHQKEEWNKNKLCSACNDWYVPLW